MEIERLRVIITEKDLNDLARKHLPKETAVEDLQISVVPEGVWFKGAYQMFMPVSFEMLWLPGVEAGRAIASLERFSTMGMPANMLRSLIMSVIADAVEKESWLSVENDVVQADIDALLHKRGFDAKTRLTSIHCEEGRVVVEAG